MKKIDMIYTSFHKVILNNCIKKKKKNEVTVMV